MKAPSLRELRRSPIARDAVALYAAQVTGLLVPIVTVPYLARVLHPDGFGLVVFAQSLAAWLILVVEYAFDLSGTRAMARVRGDAAKVERVVAGVQAAKLLITVVVTLLSGGLYVFVPLFHSHPLYLVWAWAYAVLRGFSPFWYFMGVERMKLPAGLDAGARMVAAVGVFVFVKVPDDGWRVLALQAVGAAISLSVMSAWLYRDVRFRAGGVRDALRTLRGGQDIFVFRASSGLYIQANAFILGLLTNPQVVAFFGGAEKVMRSAVGLLLPLSQAFFPRLSRLVVDDPPQARRVFAMCLVSMVGLGTGVGVVGAVAARPLVSLFLGPGYDAAVPVLRTLSLLPFIISVGGVFGLQWALPMGFDKPFYRLVLAGGVLNLVLATILAPRFGAEGMAISVVCADLLVSVGLVLLFARYGFSRTTTS